VEILYIFRNIVCKRTITHQQSIKSPRNPLNANPSPSSSCPDDPCCAQPPAHRAMAGTPLCAPATMAELLTPVAFAGPPQPPRPPDARHCGCAAPCPPACFCEQSRPPRSPPQLARRPPHF
jgi:hypothetical protein